MKISTAYKSIVHQNNITMQGSSHNYIRLVNMNGHPVTSRVLQEQKTPLYQCQAVGPPLGGKAMAFVPKCLAVEREALEP